MNEELKLCFRNTTTTRLKFYVNNANYLPLQFNTLSDLPNYFIRLSVRLFVRYDRRPLSAYRSSCHLEGRKRVEGKKVCNREGAIGRSRRGGVGTVQIENYCPTLVKTKSPQANTFITCLSMEKGQETNDK